MLEAHSITKVEFNKFVSTAHLSMIKRASMELDAYTTTLTLKLACCNLQENLNFLGNFFDSTSDVCRSGDRIRVFDAKVHKKIE